MKEANSKQKKRRRITTKTHNDGTIMEPKKIYYYKGKNGMIQNIREKSVFTLCFGFWPGRCPPFFWKYCKGFFPVTFIRPLSKIIVLLLRGGGESDLS